MKKKTILGILCLLGSLLAQAGDMRVLNLLTDENRHYYLDTGMQQFRLPICRGRLSTLHYPVPEQGRIVLWEQSQDFSQAEATTLCCQQEITPHEGRSLAIIWGEPGQEHVLWLPLTGSDAVPLCNLLSESLQWVLAGEAQVLPAHQVSVLPWPQGQPELRILIRKVWQDQVITVYAKAWQAVSPRPVCYLLLPPRRVGGRMQVQPVWW